MAGVQGACEAPSRAIARDLAKGIRADYGTLLPSAVACFEDDFEACIACAMLLVGFLWLNPLPLVIGIALILGSVALLGSNRTTLGATITSITMLEERRVQMINGLELQTVSEGPAPSRDAARMPRWIGSGGPGG